MILIVDDEIFALDLYARKLMGSGLDYATRSSVPEAKNFIENHPDTRIVVTDLHMSGENGYDLLRWLKTLYPRIKRVVVSAHTHEDMSLMKTELELDGVLKKPIDVKSELIPLLIELLKEE